jgi:radical SAM pair-associated protein
VETCRVKDVFIKVNEEIFEEVCVIKTAYLFLDKYYIFLDKEDKYIIVKLSPKNYNTDNELVADELIGEFNNELLNQKVREKISNESKNIRELILARALYSTYIDNPEVSNDYKEDYSIEVITKDWFEGMEDD